MKFSLFGYGASAAYFLSHWANPFAGAFSRMEMGDGHQVTMAGRLLAAALRSRPHPALIRPRPVRPGQAERFGPFSRDRLAKAATWHGGCRDLARGAHGSARHPTLWVLLGDQPYAGAKGSALASFRIFSAACFCCFGLGFSHLGGARG